MNAGRFETSRAGKETHSSKKSGNGKPGVRRAIDNQMRRLGASVDWQRDRFTMDAGTSREGPKSSCVLYQEGIAYIEASAW